MHTLHSLVEDVLETVTQAQSYLSSVSETDYQKNYLPHFTSCSGAHMRHVLDHFLALQLGWESGCVDYNVRHRYSEVEKCPKAALNAWQEIRFWLQGLVEQQGNNTLQVVTETSMQQVSNSITQSTLARELVFVASHAVHHFSLISALSSLLGIKADKHLGIAPSTASYQRHKAG